MELKSKKVNKMNKNITILEKENISHVLNHSGKSLYNAIKELKINQTPKEIIQIAWEIPEIKNTLNYKSLKWVINNLHDFTPEEILKKLNKPKKNINFNFSKKPKDVENIYDWFTETHKTQIKKAIKEGISIRELVRQFSNNYTPDKNPMYGFKPIRSRIDKLNIIKEKRETCLEFLTKNDEILNLINKKHKTKNIYKKAVSLGFKGSERTIQRNLKKIKNSTN